MSEQLRPVAKSIADPIARLLARLGFTPNGISYLGILLTLIAAIVIAGGGLIAGGAILLFAAALDLIDGTLARLTGTSTNFGAFLDSTLDRYSEAVILFGLSAYFIQTGESVGLLLSFATLIGSFMVSYTRARAEALNIDCKVGWLARPERVILIVVGLFTGWLLPVLWVLALFTNFTALQRVIHVRRETGGH